MSSKKRLAGLFVLIVGGAVWLGLPFYRAMQYRMSCEKVVNRVAATATHAAIFGLTQELRALIPGAGLDPSLVEVTVSMARLGMPEAPTYRLEAQIKNGSYGDLIVAKVETTLVSEDYLRELVRGGIGLVNMPEESAKFAAEAAAAE